MSQRTGEAFVVRGDDLYTAVVELAQQVGIEVEDGIAKRALIVARELLAPILDCIQQFAVPPPLVQRG